MMRLSIITINYNDLAGLKKTATSVVSQTYQDFEWILIDGGSHDGSKEFIEELSLSCPFISFWCSEPDKGIYNAMNKGIAHASGEYLQFLNSGDCLFDNDVVKQFHSLVKDDDIIAGDIVLDGKEERRLCSPDETELDFDFMRHSMVRHSASFIKKHLFLKYGYYDENFRIVSDLKFFLDVLIKHNCSYYHWNRIVSDFNTDGISERAEMKSLEAQERQKVFKQFLPRFQKTLAKRDSRIKELDIPLLPIIKKKIYYKYKKLCGFMK